MSEFIACPMEVRTMRICNLISHTAIGCGGLIGGWLVAVGQLGITMPSFETLPLMGQN